VIECVRRRDDETYTYILSHQEYPDQITSHVNHYQQLCMLLVNSQLKFDRYHLVTPLVPCQYDLLERKQNEGIDQRHDTSEYSFPGE
jgi:hypothetical protein